MAPIADRWGGWPPWAASTPGGAKPDTMRLIVPFNIQVALSKNFAQYFMILVQYCTSILADCGRSE